jgi:hypothetical protein
MHHVKKLEELLHDQTDQWLKHIKSQLEGLPDTKETKRKRHQLKSSIRNIPNKQMFTKIICAAGKLETDQFLQVEVQVGE